MVTGKKKYLIEEGRGYFKLKDVFLCEDIDKLIDIFSNKEIMNEIN